MVRAKFGVDPWKLDEDKFAELVTDALWIYKYEHDVMQASFINALVKIFGKPD